MKHRSVQFHYRLTVCWFLPSHIHTIPRRAITGHLSRHSSAYAFVSHCGEASCSARASRTRSQLSDTVAAPYSRGPLHHSQPPITVSYQPAVRTYLRQDGFSRDFEGRGDQSGRTVEKQRVGGRRTTLTREEPIAHLVSLAHLRTYDEG